MPIIQNFSGDYFLALLRDVYNKAGITPPVEKFSALQRLVDTERAEYETMRSWLRIQDDRIDASHIDAPLLSGLLNSTTIIPSSTNTYLTFTQDVWGAARPNNLFDVGSGSTYMRFKFPVADQLLILIGYVRWSGSGLTLYGEQYDSTDTQIGGQDFNPFSMTGSFWLPYNAVIHLNTAARSLRIYGYHTSGGNVPISFHILGILIK